MVAGFRFQATKQTEPFRLIAEGGKPIKGGVSVEEKKPGSSLVTSYTGFMPKQRCPGHLWFGNSNHIPDLF
uniref:Uncharacterized protein n=1 Tax=Noccaea caerulescens TaxID=107243 RepID=A0A1J3HY84_NOCCA